MNIERFIEKRKSKGLSQTELSAGICTQATLSRLENNGQVPTLKILIRLCNRLELPLGELFPKVGVQNPEIIEKMDQAEFLLITSEYEILSQQLETISDEQISSSELLLRYYYLKGFLMIYQKAPLKDTLFILDKLLLEENKLSCQIYRLLSYTGIGMVYAREQEMEKAEYYFNKVFAEIYQYQIKTDIDTWRVLNILFHCGVFYAEISDFETSDALLNYVFSICSDNHITYYLARATFQLAKNGIAQEKTRDEIFEVLQDTRAYAKLNKNQKLLYEIAKIEEELN